MSPKLWLYSLRISLLLFAILTSKRAINAYDSSSMQFHPDGRVLQIEYSKDAVKKGGPVGAYRCKDGIIIVAVRKSPISKLLVNPMQKVFKIDSNIMVAATGLLFDANVIVDVAKRLCLQHRSVYCDEMPVENLCEDLSEIMHKQTTGNSRPFGVSIIVAGIDRDLGPQLYVLDPEGSVNAWNAICIGKKSDKVMESMVESFSETSENKNISVADIWPKFQSCLRKHFPSKSAVSEKLATSRLALKQENLERSDDSLHPDTGYVALPDSLISSSRDDGADLDDHWELEVTSIMLNSEGEVCMSILKQTPPVIEPEDNQ